MGLLHLFKNDLAREITSWAMGGLISGAQRWCAVAMVASNSKAALKAIEPLKE